MDEFKKMCKTQKPSKRKRKSTNQMLESLDSTTKKLNSECKKIRREIKSLKRNQRQMQKQLDSPKNKRSYRKPSAFNRCLLRPTLPGSSDECIHGYVIRENMKKFVEAIDLSNGFLLDEMLENETLTENEANEIREISRPNQTRKLAIILSRKSKSNFLEFLKTVNREEFYPHFANTLKVSYEIKMQAHERCTECIQCFITENVNIRHIVDHLYENYILDVHEYECVINGDKDIMDQFWPNLFEKTSDPILKERNVSIFKEALQKKYPHIANRIVNPTDLTCFCKSSAMSYPSGSEGTPSDISTTSTVIQEQKQTISMGIFTDDSNHIYATDTLSNLKKKLADICLLQKAKSLQNQYEKIKSIKSHSSQPNSSSDPRRFRADVHLLSKAEYLQFVFDEADSNSDISQVFTKASILRKSRISSFQLSGVSSKSDPRHVWADINFFREIWADICLIKKARSLQSRIYPVTNGEDHW